MDFTTDQLNTRFRNEVVDLLEGDGTVTDSENLWKEVEIYGYMTEAADSLAKDTEGLYRTLPPIPLVASQQAYTVPRYVVKIRSAYLNTARVFLDQSDMDGHIFQQWDDYGREIVGYGSLFTASGGPPREYVMDYEQNKILLLPIPGAQPPETLTLQCVVTVAIPFMANMPLPFLDEVEQRIMLHFMKSLAYAKQDADTLDLKKSDEFRSKYDMYALERMSQLRRRRRSPGTVQSSW
jgi:hypothetical protein